MKLNGALALGLATALAAAAPALAGPPIAGVPVEVDTADGVILIKDRTNAQGAFTATLQPGTYAVLVGPLASPDTSSGSAFLAAEVNGEPAASTTLPLPYPQQTGGHITISGQAGTVALKVTFADPDTDPKPDTPATDAAPAPPQ